GLALVLLPVLPRGRLSAASRRRSAAVPANPDVAFVVDGDAVIRVGPVVALARSTPVADQVAGGVELENRRRRSAALRGRRRGRGVDLAGLEGSRAMDDPHVILCVDRNADRLTENPFVRQRLRPQRIDFEARRLERLWLGLPRAVRARTR